MITKHIHIDFIDDVLGTAPGDPDIHGSYVSSKAPDAATKEEEIAAIGEDEFRAKGKTIFPTDKDGTPIFFTYQIKGFFKSACSAQRTLKGTLSSKVKAYKKKVDLQIFVYPDADDPSGRKVRIHTTKAGVGECQRPLRAETMQGPRVAIADSESIEKGSWIEFDVVVLDEGDWDLVKEWLDYGRFNGLGQWRNSGKGAFVWHEINHKPTTIFK